MEAFPKIETFTTVIASVDSTDPAVLQTSTGPVASSKRDVSDKTDTTTKDNHEKESNATPVASNKRDVSDKTDTTTKDNHEKESNATPVASSKRKKTDTTTKDNYEKESNATPVASSKRDVSYKTDTTTEHYNKTILKLQVNVPQTSIEEERDAGDAGSDDSVDGDEVNETVVAGELEICRPLATKALATKQDNSKVRKAG